MNSPETSHLLPCLARLAQLQHESVDRLALQEAVAAAQAVSDAAGKPQRLHKTVTEHLQVKAARW